MKVKSAIGSIVACMSIAGSVLANTSDPQIISAREAAAIAVNEVHTQDSGLLVENPLHRIHLSEQGLLFKPRSGGPEWRWELSSIQLSGQDAVSVQPIVPVAATATVLAYNRDTVIEQYVLHGQSIEQQFLLPEALEMAGDLVITGEIQSAGTFASNEQGWVWSNESGEVTLGDVTVIDANGIELPAEMQVTATSSSILIPESTLLAAAYPLLIDPEIGTNDMRISDAGTNGVTSIFAFDPAITYNSTNNEYLVVWGADDTVDNEFEIYGQRINAVTGAEVGTNDFRISTMGPNLNTAFRADLPDVAYNATANEYLVVWQGDDVTDGDTEIHIQRLSNTGTELGTDDLAISDLGPAMDSAFGAFRPRVAWNSTNNEYLVVWYGDDVVNNDLEIYGQRITAAGAETGTNDFVISSMGGAAAMPQDYDARNPEIAYNSTNNEYLVVWHGDDNIAPLVDEDQEIFGQRINAATGAEVGSDDFRISDMGGDGALGFSAFDAEVAYNATNNEYLVVWAGEDNVGGLVVNEFEVFGQRLTASTGAEVGTNDFRISVMGGSGNTAFLGTNPAVAWNSALNEYIVAWEGEDNTGGLVDDEREIYVKRLTGAAAADIGTQERISDMGGIGDADFDGVHPTVVFPGNEAYIAWSGDDNVAPLVVNETEIFGQRFSVVDNVPDAFVFVDQTDVPLSDLRTSNTITVSGINSGAAISIVGGEYQIGAGVFTGSGGTVNNGDMVTVRQTSSALFNTTTDATLTIGGVSDTFSVTTILEDTTPDAFAFVDQTDVPLSDLRTSNTITVSGINSGAAISIVGGEYQIGAGGFTSLGGTVNNGDMVTVRQTSSASFNTTTDATLTVGGVSDTFSVTTILEDTTPDAFVFVDQTDVPLSDLRTSNTITVSGINSGAAISIVGGEYQIGAGVFTGSGGTVNNGDMVTVRQTSSALFNTTTDATLTIGGVSDTFSVTTILEDTTPDAFAFVDQTDVPLSDLRTSNTITVSGINSGAAISIVGGEYQIGAGVFTGSGGTVNNGDMVTVRQTSSASFNTTTDATLTVGGVSDTFSVTTIMEDTTPDPFAFVSQMNVLFNTLVTSNSITVMGINSAAPITITDGEYSINGSPFASGPGMVNAGDVVVVRVLSAPGPNTLVTATLDIGGVQGIFNVTTRGELESIPSLSTWAMILMALLLAGVGYSRHKA